MAKLDNNQDTEQSNKPGAAGIASAIGGGITSLFSTFNNTSKLDGSAQETANNINTVQDNLSNIQTDTVNDWLSSMDNIPTALDYTNYNNVWGSKGNKALNTLMGAANGAAAGAAAGPFGALAGAAVGLGSGIAGIFTGKKKAKRLANNLNDVTTALNESINASKINATNQTIQHLYNNDMRNLNALGGVINTRNSGVLSPFGNRFALGGTNGTDFNTGLMEFNTGGTHEENPNEGVQIGTDSQGTPNLVEEGEVMLDNYVFSNRLKVPEDLKEQYKLGKKKDITYADAIKTLSKESKERPNDPISKKSLRDMASVFAQSQEEAKMLEKLKDPAFRQQMMMEAAQQASQEAQAQQPQEQQVPEDIQQYQESQQQAMETPVEQYALGGRVNKFAGGGIPNIYEDEASQDVITPPTEDSTNTINSTNTAKKTTYEVETPAPTEEQIAAIEGVKALPTWMRYAPVVGTGLGVLTDVLGLTNKPDYTEANMLMNAASNAGKFSPIRGQYIGNYMRYNPFDINYTTNALAQQAAAANRNIANTSGGNRAAAMAAQSNANYQTQLAVANALKQSIEQNNAQRLQVSEFNRGTDQFNAQQANAIAQANLNAAMKVKNSYLKGIAQAAALRQKERLLADQSKSANLTNLFNNIGNVGKDNWARNQVMANTLSGVYGPINPDLLPMYLSVMGINPKGKRGKAAAAMMNKSKN